MSKELDDLERSLPLPDFLELEQPYGEIRLTGHRILLPHVVRAYVEGFSPEMLWERFPTLSLSHIHKVIAYYLDHREQIDRYMALRDEEIDRQAAAYPQRFSLAELRKRLEAKNRAAATAKDFV